MELELRGKTNVNLSTMDTKFSGLKSNDDLRGQVKQSPQAATDDYLRDDKKSTVMSKPWPKWVKKFQNAQRSTSEEQQPIEVI